MKKLLVRSAIGSGLVLFSFAAFAAQVEELQTLFGEVIFGGFALVAIAMVVIGAFKPMPEDKSAATLHTLLSEADATHSVQADALVMDCITMMNEPGCDSLLVMDDKKLVGIFTDRDALRKVLFPGRDPRRTRICEVMTLDPCCFSPKTTIGAANELMTRRQFKHLPIVENGRVHGVLSRRELRRWLYKDQRAGRAREPLKRAA